MFGLNILMLLSALVAIYAAATALRRYFPAWITAFAGFTALHFALNYSANAGQEGAGAIWLSAGFALCYALATGYCCFIVRYRQHYRIGILFTTLLIVPGGYSAYQAFRLIRQISHGAESLTTSHFQVFEHKGRTIHSYYISFAAGGGVIPENSAGINRATYQALRNYRGVIRIFRYPESNMIERIEKITLSVREES